MLFMDGSALLARARVGGKIAPTKHAVLPVCLRLVECLVGTLEDFFGAVSVFRKGSNAHTGGDAGIVFVFVKSEILDPLSKAFGKDPGGELVGLRADDDELVAADSGGNVDTAETRIQIFPELREDLSVMEDLDFTPEEARDLQEVERSAEAGLFCQQCGYCRPQCPLAVEIPTLMRAHMYAVGHRRPDKARSVLRGFSADDIGCVGCATCTVQCALGLDIRPQALEMRELLA